MRKTIIATAIVAAGALAFTACGSDSEGTPGSDGEAATSPFKVGTFASLTGPASATFKAVPGAVKARIKAYEAAGGKCADRGFDVIEADDVSTPEGALKASQKLVQSDKVDGIVQASSFFYGASQFLTTQAKETVVVGGGFDGAPEYSKTDNNLFGVMAPVDYESVFTSPIDFFASQGVTKWAAIAYDSPSATRSLEQSKKSAEAQDMPVGYFNSKVPFGSTDVGPLVQGIIESGANGLQASLNPETSFGVIAGLRQAGYDMKSVVLATGYGADLLKSEPAVKAAQGVTFTTGWLPTELGGEAIEAQSAALKEYGGNESGVPSFAEAMGWMGADLLLHGLELAGCDASGEEVTKALRTDNTWNAGGLYPNTRDFGSSEMTNTCSYYLTLKEKQFVPVEGASPLCSEKIK